MPDSAVWPIAVTENRLLITTDKGFMEYWGWPHHGILVVRLRQPNRQRIHKVIMQVMDRFSESDWQGMLVVARDTKMTISRYGKRSEI